MVDSEVEADLTESFGSAKSARGKRAMVKPKRARPSREAMKEETPMTEDQMKQFAVLAKVVADAQVSAKPLMVTPVVAASAASDPIVGGFAFDAKSVNAFETLANQATPLAICSSPPATPNFMVVRDSTPVSPPTKDETEENIKRIIAAQRASSKKDSSNGNKKMSKAEENALVHATRVTVINSANNVKHSKTIIAQNVTLTAEKPCGPDVPDFAGFYSNPQHQVKYPMVLHSNHKLSYTSIRFIPDDSDAAMMKSATKLDEKKLFHSEYVDVFHAPFIVKLLSNNKISGASFVAVRMSFFRLLVAFREGVTVESAFMTAPSIRKYVFKAYIQGRPTVGPTACLEEFILVPMLASGQAAVYNRTAFTGTLGTSLTNEKNRQKWIEIAQELADHIAICTNEIQLKAEDAAAAYAVGELKNKQLSSEMVARLQEADALRSEHADTFSFMKKFAAVAATSVFGPMVQAELDKMVLAARYFSK
jgi:hypothetical protein